MSAAKRSLELVAMIGPPNSGKTTLFNWITGSKFKTVNYPGSTIDYSVGSSHSRFGNVIEVIDTPGIYSLFPKSSDEVVTHDVLFADTLKKRIHHVIVVVDATQLARNLYLVRQLQEAGYSYTIALTMMDLIRKQGIEIDIKKIEEVFKCHVIPIDGTLGGGVKDLIQDLADSVFHDQPVTKLISWTNDKRENILKELEMLSKTFVHTKNKKFDIFSNTVKLDKILLNPAWGLVLFAVIMAVLFSSIFWAAKPFMDGIDSLFGFLAEKTTAILGTGMVSNFLTKGIIASFSAVLVFAPQIFILFLGIGILEDSGYLARAATLIDKPFSKIGLNGRSFIPILSGFACAIPAIMASRTLGNRRERMITTFIIPLMTCSARLPVYALLLSFVYAGQSAWKPGIALAALYFGALVVGGIAAGILNTFLKKEGRSLFMLELPLYRKPKWSIVFRTALNKTKSYALRAGPIIFGLSLAIWALSMFPNSQIEDRHARLEQSYFGQMGKTIEPVFRPMGSDWRVGVGLLSAFAAREVFVSTLAVIFNVTESDDKPATQKSLLEKMKTATMSDGTLVFTPASIAALLIFFMIALQCASTVGITIREMRSWSFAMTQLVLLNVVAYVCAIATYRILS